VDGLLHRFRWRIPAYFAVSWVFIILAPFSRSWHFPDFIPWYVSAYINGEKPHAFFTIFPYANYICFGAFVTHHLVHGAMEAPWKNGKALFLGLAAAILAFTVAPHLIPEKGFITDTFFPKLAFYAKAQFLLLVGVWVCYRFQERVGFGPLLPAGAHTMAAYWIHAKIIFILFAPFAAAASWPACGGLLVAAYTLTTVLTFGYINLQRYRKSKQ
jgi:hypothetical protein